MITIKNISASSILIPYDKLDANRTETFLVNGVYDLQETLSVQTTKGASLLISEVLQGNMQVRLNNNLLDTSEASEYCIQANRNETLKNQIIEKLLAKSILLEGFAGGFLYVDELKVTN